MGIEIRVRLKTVLGKGQSSFPWMRKQIVSFPRYWLQGCPVAFPTEGDSHTRSVLFHWLYPRPRGFSLTL